jgi:hypothetical protein
MSCSLCAKGTHHTECATPERLVQGAEPVSTSEATPTVVIYVIRAEGMRKNKGRDPKPSMLMRVSMCGIPQSQLLKTRAMPAGVNQTWSVSGLKW